jgi:hypothetical protein
MVVASCVRATRVRERLRSTSEGKMSASSFSLKWPENIDLRARRVLKVALGQLGALSRYHKQLAPRQILHHDKAGTVKRLGSQIPDLEICVRLELPPEKGYPGKQFRRYRSLEEHVPDNIKELLSATSGKIKARHAEALVMLKDYPEKQLFRYYR